nr:MAG TPA: hypothetical protein [Caudoviricetes sp.]
MESLGSSPILLIQLVEPIQSLPKRCTDPTNSTNKFTYSFLLDLLDITRKLLDTFYILSNLLIYLYLRYFYKLI